ncbi:unnamed protein product [Caenorhabditis angaria]|uniref:DUF4604 domain-containing protein n=1 Tax=Caenorhabditis angaria TaxID=860376 RepID=A0A9P1I6S8_9PELO|nr:unnamed protein product [Caenorhabditis angaria]
MSRGTKSTMSYKDKANLKFVEQEEPAFIKAMKAKMGYKEPAKLEDKFDDEGPSNFDDDETELLRMKEEDRPQVVVLNESTDLTKEQLEKELEVIRKEEDDQKIAEGKITFKKPVKRLAEGEKEEDDKKKKKTVIAEPKKTLLSFGDDEEEDE